ncbi:MAG: mannose-1-phosphate guanylyltransferase [Candidatus Sumerlaeia bacterium]
MYYAVIMAGGAGERFWPYSRRTLPKQLLPLIDNKTMLEHIIEAIGEAFAPERIFVAANKLVSESIRKRLSMIPPENILSEPVSKNTAPCLALAMGVISRLDPEAVVGVFTADHLIRKVQNFRKNLKTALKCAQERSTIVTLGIPPTRPETGFGYVEFGEECYRTDSGCAHSVKRFREKPSLEQARDFLAQGNFYWNSGMFFWTVRTFEKECEQHCPELAETIREIRRAWGTPEQERVVCRCFEHLPRLSIDYALMERTRNVAMVAAEFQWDDVGAWEALARIGRPDQNGNVAVGDVLLLDCSNTIVFGHADAGSVKPVIAGLGLKDLIIVQTTDAILVCPRSEAQRVKELVEALREKGKTHIL